MIREPALAEKLLFMRDPASYPEGTRRVDAVETHLSWVFLTDAHAYKLKKPERLDELDFRLPESRRRNAEEEVRLNRRLAPQVYLGVVPLVMDGDGRLAVGGAGNPVDWLVKMVRLDARRMLDRCILERSYGRDDVDNLAFLLARFFKDQPSVTVDPARYLAHFETEIDLAVAELHALGGSSLQASADSAASATRRLLSCVHPMLAARIDQGRIVEGHGDLRPEHVWLGPPPLIIDCLEFNRDLRLLDPLDELAFLALECRRLGAPEIGETLCWTYEAVTDDRPHRDLRRFYSGFRAMVRARIAIRHLRDAAIRNPEKWPAQAATYLEIAMAAAQGCDEPRAADAA
jgi:uncharacterized protein